MNEIVIKKVDYLPEQDMYVARCIVVIGKVVPNTTWILKYNPKRKLILQMPLSENKSEQYYFVDFIIDKLDMDIHTFNKPTSWLNK